MKKITIIEEVGQTINSPGIMGSTRRNTRTTITYLLFGFIPVYKSTEEFISLLN